MAFLFLLLLLIIYTFNDTNLMKKNGVRVKKASSSKVRKVGQSNHKKKTSACSLKH